MSVISQSMLDALARRWESELATAMAATDRPRIVRAEVPVDDCDLLSWLGAQSDRVKTYWSDRDGSFAMAGVGAASSFTHQAPLGLTRLFNVLRSNLSARYPNLRYYGGIRFDRNKPKKGPWNDFGAQHFVVPKFELGRKGNLYHIAYNEELPGHPDRTVLVAEMRAYLDRVAFPADSVDAKVPAVRSRKDAPNRSEWTDIVETIEARLKDKGLQKVVLARRSLFELAAPADPVVLLQKLVARTTYSFHYCFQLAPDAGFIGASPERLYKRQSSYMQSEALAGTRPRGATPDEDSGLGRELLKTDKEIREHQLVQHYVQAFFEKHCGAVRGGDKLELLALRHCQHLLTRFEGMLKVPDSDGALLQDIHPTPAVGGVPTEDAMRQIALAEPSERGWYAGPVGWVGYDGTEFAVAIRCGLIAGNELSLYSGAGIVAGSKPDEEWDEIENKMTNFLSILNEAG